MSSLQQENTVIYQARRVATQANAAGGKIIIDINGNPGQIMRIVSLLAYNSGTNTLNIMIVDEDWGSGPRCGYLASAAGNSMALPSIGSPATATSNSIDTNNLLIAPGQYLSIQQSEAGIQNDTLTVYLTLELFNSRTAPNWSIIRSTNAGNVTLAASTISAGNTTVAGRIIV